MPEATSAGIACAGDAYELYSQTRMTLNAPAIPPLVTFRTGRALELVADKLPVTANLASFYFEVTVTHFFTGPDFRGRGPLISTGQSYGSGQLLGFALCDVLCAGAQRADDCRGVPATRIGSRD